VLGRVVAALLEGLPDLRLVLKQLPDVAVAVGQVQLLGHPPDRGLPSHDQGILVNLHRVDEASVAVEIPNGGVHLISEARLPAEPVEAVDAGVVHHAGHPLCLSAFIILSVHTLSISRGQKMDCGGGVFASRLCRKPAPASGEKTSPKTLDFPTSRRYNGPRKRGDGIGMNRVKEYRLAVGWSQEELAA